jgi:hypothetical protein
MLWPLPESSEFFGLLDFWFFEFLDFWIFGFLDYRTFRQKTNRARINRFRAYDMFGAMIFKVLVPLSKNPLSESLIVR